MYESIFAYHKIVVFMVKEKFGKRRRISSVIFVVLFFSLIITGTHISASQEQMPAFNFPALLNTEPSNNPLQIQQDFDDPIEMENLILEILLGQYSDFNLVGMTYSVVRNGSILVSGGYGASDYIALTPVDPNTTLFRLGSISKTFIAISILQLMEDGLIDLEEDVNSYLTAFQIPDTYEEPITIRHLLTHTAGFEETVKQSVFETEYEMPDLEETLMNEVPNRVNPPGELLSYSNFGYCLLGYIIEELTALPYELYIQLEILDPFGMNHTTFEQPLPPHLEPDMATGYGENREEAFFEYLSISPAAAITSTAGDMSKFMVAMLNNATFNGNQILENSTVTLMQSEQFTTHPDLPGMCFGLYEMDANDQHIIGHGGDTVFFHSRMALFPEYDLGVFISYNNREGSIAKGDFFDQFIEHYFPYQNDNVTPMEGYTQDLNEFTGIYVPTRRKYTSVFRIPKDYWVTIMGIQIYSTGEYLKLLGANLEFVQIAPGYFIERSGDLDYTIIFFRDENERVTYFHSNIVGPTMTYEKIHYIYYHLEDFNTITIVFSIIFILSLVYWGSRGLYRFLTTSESTKSLDTIIKWWSIGFPSTILPYVFYLNTKSEEVIFLEKEVPGIFGSTYILLILGSIFTIGQVLFAIISWVEFKPSSLKKKNEEQQKDEQEEVEVEEIEVEELEEPVEEKQEDSNEIFVKIERAFSKIQRFQPLYKRLLYSLLAIISVTLMSLLISWNLLDIF